MCREVLAVDEHEAGPAGPDAAAELGAGQAEVLAEHPQQRLGGVGLDGVGHTVDGERELHGDSKGNAAGSGVEAAVRMRLRCR